MANAVVIFAVSPTTRRSHASASDRPAPAAAPSTAATTGLLISCRMRDASMRPRSETMRSSRLGALRFGSAMPRTSPPTQNVPPAPFSSTARTSGSSAARCAACSSPSVKSGLIAFFRSGRFMVMVRRPSFRSCKMTSVMASSGCIDWRQQWRDYPGRGNRNCSAHRPAAVLHATGPQDCGDRRRATAA